MLALVITARFEKKAALLKRTLSESRRIVSPIRLVGKKRGVSPLKALNAARPVWAALILALAATLQVATAQDDGASPTLQVEVEIEEVDATTDDAVMASSFGSQGGLNPTPQYPPPTKAPLASPQAQMAPPVSPQMAPTAWPQVAPPVQAPHVPQMLSAPQAATMMVVPQMTSAPASLVQVPAQNVVIQQPELRVFMAQPAPLATLAGQPLAAQPMAASNIFLPQAAASVAGPATVPMAAPPQAVAVPTAVPSQAVGVPMAAPAQAVAVPMAAPTQAVAAEAVTAGVQPVAMPAAAAGAGAVTSQAIALASGESTSRFEIEAPSRLRTRLADVLEGASVRVRGRVRMRSVQETELRSPQGQVGGGGLMNISHSFAAPGIAQTTAPVPAQPQVTPPVAPPQPIYPAPPPTPHQPPLPPAKRPPVAQKTPPVPHKHH